mmetsp:Transcript_18515/g.22658  ORF Transcript_18515/g.22658 Transcript_18515/m.22658 type:complete len:288 (+) Transcript_18515:586-1449(+)|eukprot:CAMPEP_0204843680 /NCGR_PEP_ID=MMETSP1346-20131115/48121_1 /ASSEMBLY_ACC=CAM_ASM_000771 /TAXON_ID=215587 /ORGANISM="Aplanochytrium stocchinoi, Strain GSBS06" /LENGTH=287 /DNA_ID=CAMNT_0051982865 /DNA_START=475 /DNA_END=1338 /DNA_ORIENTATION=-
MAGASKLGIPEAVTAFCVRFGAHFFSYPFKPLLNRYEGSPYEVAYKHFRRDHMGNLNLLLHVLCFVGQLTSNYTLLNEIDKFLGTRGLVALTTTASWSYELAQAPAPALAKILSVASLYLAYRTRGCLEKTWETIVFWQIFLDTLSIHILLLKKPMTDLKTFFIVLSARTALHFVVERKKNSLANKQGNQIIKYLLLSHLIISARPPVFSAPYLIGLYGWIVAKLTGQAWIYYWSLGYVASLAQAVAHTISDEPATLPQLTSIPDEIAHTVFFPNILFQSILQNFKM